MIKIFGLLIIFWLIKVVLDKRVHWKLLSSFIGGVVISLAWWFNKWQGMLGEGLKNVGEQGTSNNLFQKILLALPNDSGSATKAYTFKDFFIAEKTGMINVQIGWGIFISILVFLGLLFLLFNYKKIFSKKGTWYVVVLAWFVATFLAANSLTFNLPVGLMSFRTWLLLSIPVAILASYGLKFILDVNKKAIPVALIVIILILGVWFTAGYQKYNQNTQVSWPFGSDWSSASQVQGFIEMKQKMTNEPVYTLCGIDELVIGLDQTSYPWREGITSFRDNLEEKSVDDIITFLDKHNYEYLIYDTDCVDKLSQEKINTLLNDVVQTGRFKQVISKEGFFLFSFY